MFKKSFFGTMFLFGLSLLAMSSCRKDDPTPAKPVITIKEVGSHDGPEGVVAAGDDLHLEAEIVAEGLIDKVAVEIHREDGTGDEIEAEYTEYAGQKNATFHKHIDIPANAPLGDYHLHLTVTDKQGQSATAEAELEIVAEDED